MPYRTGAILEERADIRVTTTLPASGAPAQNIRLGIALTLIGMLLFSINDVLGKWLVSNYSVGQVLLIRSLAALTILLPMFRRGGLASALRVERPGLHALRVLLSTLEVSCFYLAVVFLPLADVMTYYLAGPIYVAAMSPLLLGERVGWRRWTAVLVGFVGVLIALNPSAASLTFPALVSVAGSIFFALMIVTTRTLRGTGDKVLVLWQTVGALLAGLVAAPFSWTPAPPRDLALLALLGIVAMGAHVCVNRSLKLAPAAVVSPYQYTLLVWAILFGYPVFGDVPTVHMLAGATIIVGAGLFIFFREQRAKTRAAAG